MDSEQKFSKASTNYLSNPLVLTQMLVGAPHCLSVLLRVVKSVLFSISTISIHKGSSKITKKFSGHSLSFDWWQIFDSLLNLVCFGPKRQPRESQEPSFSGFLNFFIFYCAEGAYIWVAAFFLCLSVSVCVCVCVCLCLSEIFWGTKNGASFYTIYE